VNEAVPLECAQGTVETARVVADEPERSEPLEQLVTMRRLLAQEEEQAGTEEVPREHGLDVS
jgi:hypothetical protein